MRLTPYQLKDMLVHGIDVPAQIRHDNTLARPLRDYGPRDRVDVILTNPPFGGMEEDGIETNFPTTFRTKETADLFLVLIMHLLKDGGRGALVLPDGTLFGTGVKSRIKEERPARLPSSLPRNRAVTSPCRRWCRGPCGRGCRTIAAGLCRSL